MGTKKPDCSRSGAQSHYHGHLKSFWIFLTFDQDKLVRHTATGNESWTHHWDPENKQESMQWKHASFPLPRKFKTQPSAGKIMATIFWYSKGALLIDYLPVPNKTTMNGQYYANLQLKLRQAINDKRRGMLMYGVWLLHDNSPVHKFTIAQQVVLCWLPLA